MYTICIVDNNLVKNAQHKFLMICCDSRQLFGSEVLSFLLVDVLHEHTFVLKHVSLHLQIETVVPAV